MPIVSTQAVLLNVNSPQVITNAVWQCAVILDLLAAIQISASIRKVTKMSQNGSPGTVQEAGPAGLLAAIALSASKRTSNSVKYLGAH